ncbi:MAG: cyclic nucleotide-binding domain-containing protein [Deltaproteobacteria bacterium]|nr:cyclic nucleotide-binding domain-containing protein [Deltaproteobacteria bacterium]
MYEVEFEFDGSGKFKPSGNVVKVIIEHLKKNNIDQAASLVAASDAEVGNMLIREAESGASRELWKKLATLFGTVRDAKRAAACAEAVGDAEMAAGFHEAAYDWIEAAETYKKAGVHHKAAEMYERGLAFDKAASVYLESKNYLRSAACYARAGNNYRAGYLYMKVGRYEQAVEVLQKVDRLQKEFIETSILLGRFFEKMGNTAMAIERYNEVVQSRHLDEDTVEVHHRLAVVLAKENQLKKAQQLWKGVLEVDPNHKGAIDGLKLLAGQAAPSRPPQARVSIFPSGSNDPPPLILPGDTAAPGVIAPTEETAPKKKRPASVVIMRGDFDAFRKLPIFAELSLEELKLVHTLADRVAFSPGDVLIEQNQPGENLFVIISGKVRVELISKGKKPIEVAVLGMGASVGEMALVDEAPTSARVTAIEPVTAFGFPLERLRVHLKTDSRSGFKIMRVLCRILSLRLREANLTISG